MKPNHPSPGSAVDHRTLPRAAGASPAPVRPDFGVSAFPFALSQVRLTTGRWLENQNRTLAYLRFIDADRMLHTFRTNVGLPSSAQPVGGWEAPDVELRGHTTGHLLTALAQAYAITGDSAYRRKGDYLVDALAACQAASPSAGYRAGYLSAFPENFFDRLENGQAVWAPWYTLHKIMAGPARPVPAHRQRPGADRAHGEGRLGGPADRTTEPLTDAVDAGERVRRHGRRADRPLPADR